MPARRSACAALALLLAAAGCSDPDDEPERADRPATTTTAPGGANALPPALDDTEVVGGADVETLEELLAVVEDARGREFLTAPAVRLADDDTYEEVLGDLLGATLEDLLAEAAYLEALGLIPEGSAVAYAEAKRQQLLSTLGFFDDETGILLVRGTDLDDPSTQAIVVHELVHAYDHQHFSLLRPAYEVDRTTERGHTFPMVSEGDAARVEQDFVESLPAAVREEVLATNGSYPTDVDELEDVVTFDAAVTYVAGIAFVRHLAAVGGEGLVDNAVGDPPLTTEQVLHPEVFDRGEVRRPVPPPPAEAPVIDHGVHGELFWTSVLRFTPSGLAPDEAAAAALGWGGDAYVSWIDDGGRTCTRSDVEGDSTADTAELLDALEVWVTATPEGTVEVTDEGRVRVQVCYVIPVSPTGNPSR